MAAAQVVTALSTDSALQTRIGTVSVLDATQTDAHLKFGLIHARPRPRSAHWAEIDTVLASQIRAARFNDVPAKLKFEAPVVSASTP